MCYVGPLVAVAKTLDGVCSVGPLVAVAKTLDGSVFCWPPGGSVCGNSVYNNMSVSLPCCLILANVQTCGEE